jgi:hypothetical protein
MFDSHTWPAQSLPARVNKTRLSAIRETSTTLALPLVLMCQMRQGDWQRTSVIDEEDS